MVGDRSSGWTLRGGGERSNQGAQGCILPCLGRRHVRCEYCVAASRTSALVYAYFQHSQWLYASKAEQSLTALCVYLASRCRGPRRTGPSGTNLPVPPRTIFCQETRTRRDSLFPGMQLHILRRVISPKGRFLCRSCAVGLAREP